MASSSLDTGSLYDTDPRVYTNPTNTFNRQIITESLFYINPSETNTEYILPPTGSDSHAGKPNIL
jgi:hypothetical protein